MSDFHLTLDDLQDGPLDEENQLDALARAIRRNERFALFFAVCNHGEYRRELMAKLCERLNGVPVEEIRLVEEARSLLDALRGRPGVGEARAVFVEGMEGWIRSGPEREGHPFVLNLNAGRNHLPEATRAAVVFWVPQYLLSIFARGAPDFFSIRSGLYAFAPTASARHELAQEMTRMGWDETIRLLPTEHEERIARLRRLLAEYEAQSEHERDQLALSRLHSALGNTLRAHGLPFTALPHDEQALALDREVLGEHHSETLTSMNNLAETYRAIGRHEDAMSLHRETLALRKEVLGDYHPDILMSMGNLATPYRVLGRHSDALELDQEVFVRSKEVLGERHPYTLTSMNNLASSYWAIGRHTDALQIDQEVLALRKEVLGERHPHTLISMGNLAETCRAMGRYADALKLQKETLERSKEALGEHHPHTLTSMSNLAVTLGEVGNLTEAEGLLQEAVAGYGAVLGPEHPDTAQARKNLRQCRLRIEKSEG